MSTLNVATVAATTVNATTVNATTALNTAAINGGQLAGFRNRIINGNFNIWQRATSFTGLTTTYTRLADRFGWFQGASGTAVVDITQSTDVPTMSEAGVYAPYSLYVDVTTADASIAAGDLAGIQYLVEGYDSAPFGFGQTGASEITLSFWVKATKTGTYCVSFLNSAEDRSYAAEYTISSSATWEKKTITLTADTTGTWLYTNGRGCMVNFMLACGSTYQISNETWTGSQGYGTSSQVNALDSNSNDFRLALIQLEIGDTATPFEQRGIGTELALCQRYFSKSYALTTQPGTATTTGVVGIQTESFTGNGTGTTTIFMPVDMRSSATITIYNPNTTNSTGAVGKVGGGSQAINAPAGSHRIFYFSLTGATSNSQYYAHYTASAEL
jgi:hypothetical protein